MKSKALNFSKVVQGLNLARSGVYFLEQLPLSVLGRFLNRELPPPTNDQVRTLWKHILRLHEREQRNLELGIYPWRAVDRENPLQHFRSFLEVMGDGVRVAMRMKSRNAQHFSAQAEAVGKDLPEYYTRNFHFQTDGYLSEASARRYYHQVEILFSGTAGAMRRLILPVIKSHGRLAGRWLELGCGSGSATRPVLETFPDAKVTALDLSAPYLKVAQENLRRYNRVDFLQGDATNLDFKNETFDVVYSVFVMHELPKAERGALVREAFRVLKPGGLLVIADSLQTGDEPELEWALERFPKSYHEPFFKNYCEDKLAKLMKQATGEVAREDHVLFTKVVWVEKPLSSALS